MVSKSDVTAGDGVLEKHDWYRVCGLQQCNVSGLLQKMKKLLSFCALNDGFHIAVCRQFPVREGDW